MLKSRSSPLCRGDRTSVVACPFCAANYGYHRAGLAKLSTCRIENGGARAAARDAHAPLFQVTQYDIHHRRHQCVVEGVVLGEGWDAEIPEDRREREIEHRVCRRIAIL